jgi:hypothetical protein
MKTGFGSILAWCKNKVKRIKAKELRRKNQENRIKKMNKIILNFGIAL